MGPWRSQRRTLRVDGGPGTKGVQAEGPAEDPGGRKRQHIPGSASWWGWSLPAVPLASSASRAGVPQPRSPSPEHLPRLSVLGVPGEAETLLLPLTELEGPLPVPSRLCPHCPQQSLERTPQHPVLVEGASPHLQLHPSCCGGQGVSPSNSCSAESPGCVGRTSVSRVDLCSHG